MSGGHHESINEILQKDTEDESLRKYKEQLLGAAAKGVPKTDDPRRVVVETFGLKFPDGEHPDIIREVDTPEKVTKLENEPINIKEGVKYQFVVTYRVQHDIVPALHFVNTIKKTMVTVDQQNTMMGSYAPRVEPYTYKSQPQYAPSGMLARGSFKANTKFVDDDGNTHLEMNYNLVIKKDWTD
ncbi:hypothetical protein FDP41_000633 [Naegleria fowleri]|uniref:Rho GDP-dissociation inhibitor n=1 Tax=Naegleria fowleri TaxID=5763 RepID=A0A6A5CDS9_NAEFO|nr:uncharacterized protein FDP41_000633 [Naegleria fowleri]KAF0984734.1 hypothetical protein FDP41_000633 [Naegleria fowleri]CAG4716764.1 unnamed protein product [Naegleria fowleri]